MPSVLEVSIVESAGEAIQWVRYTAQAVCYTVIQHQISGSLSTSFFEISRLENNLEGGIIGLFETDVYIESTASATGNRLPVGSVDRMFLF